jgi:hypothetical protein
MFVHLQSQTEDDPCGAMWSVGSYEADGRFVAESDWATAAEAANRCYVLNILGVAVAELALIRPGHNVADALMP